MQNVRIYGKEPFDVAVVHGGPGACGEMAPVAWELGKTMGVLEPIQTKTTIDGQIDELAEVVKEHGKIPITLIGHSWGAWLVFMTASRYPKLIKKLILIGSGPFEQKYTDALHATRKSRLTDEENVEFDFLLETLSDPATPDKHALMMRLGELAGKLDTYEAIPIETGPFKAIGPDGDAFQGVMHQAGELRKSGKLIEFAKGIECPVVAINGDYDTHSGDGVKEPLARELTDFRFVLLEKCGHDPWRERYAREAFFQILREELSP